MDHSVFSEAVLHVLQTAGWSPQRHVDISKYIVALEAEGFTVFPVVRDFLSAFGGLLIVHTWEEEIETRSGPTRHTFRDIIELDAVDFADNVHPDNIDRYQTCIRQPLCVLGVWEGRTLLMDPLGKVYGGFGPELWYCGDSGAQAIETLLTSKQIVKLM